ncbi:hypothetical protein M9979_12735 [Sphingomonas sp. RP10(2022)]|uniref:Uncharacterized protein n=1 Tax=Sphingomonas liriopis TaxID=2949094 RepID=A0A9X2HZK3_9SPHN|nr:hypothetical protein [Sphingomonas liriopis]MCP3735740.1 hypothetical protein [Sphingomonas liriopis]
MTASLTATFDTRREAEMAVERLVQQFDLDRDAIRIIAEGEDNSVGEDTAGADTEAGAPSPDDRSDAPLNGAIRVTVDLADDTAAAEVRDAFAEFDASDVDRA